MSSFSQNVTKKDTTSILLPNIVARQVAKDLIRGDYAIQQVYELEKILSLSENKIAIQDSIISIKNKQLENSNFIISDINRQLALEKDISKNLKKSLNASGIQLTLFKTTTIVFSVATLTSVTLFLLNK